MNAMKVNNPERVKVFPLKIYEPLSRSSCDWFAGSRGFLFGII